MGLNTQIPSPFLGQSKNWPTNTDTTLSGFKTQVSLFLVNSNKTPQGSVNIESDNKRHNHKELLDYYFEHKIYVHITTLDDPELYQELYNRISDTEIRDFLKQKSFINKLWESKNGISFLFHLFESNTYPLKWFPEKVHNVLIYNNVERYLKAILNDVEFITLLYALSSKFSYFKNIPLLKQYDIIEHINITRVIEYYMQSWNKATLTRIIPLLFSRQDFLDVFRSILTDWNNEEQLVKCFYKKRDFLDIIQEYPDIKKTLSDRYDTMTGGWRKSVYGNHLWLFIKK